MNFKDLPHQEHADFLDDMEIMAGEAYDFAVSKMIDEIMSNLHSENLTKSKDDKKLRRGWTGRVSRVEVDIDSVLDKTLGRYLKALKYILLGKAAGLDAKKAAEDIGLTKKIIPGILQSSYLHSIDTHRDYFEKITGKTAPKIPLELIKESMNDITRQTERFIDESLLRLKNRIFDAVDTEVQVKNTDNLVNKLHGDTHKITDKINKRLIAESIKVSTDGYKTDWNRMVNADLSIASAVGTHQIVTEVYGRDDRDVKVAWVAMRDEKTCDFCRSAAFNADGSFKLHGVGDFKPAGYNYGKKKKDWKLVIPGAHPNCRCNLVYIPKGFKINKDGSVEPNR